jgi:hypothetical protein
MLGSWPISDSESPHPRNRLVIEIDLLPKKYPGAQPLETDYIYALAVVSKIP